MPNDVSPQAVLQAIAELRQWVGELGQLADTLSDFAFKWAARNGGVPQTKAAMDRLLADYRAGFSHQPEVPDEQAMQGLEERYQDWAKERGVATAKPEDFERFDDETGLVTRRIDELSGFTVVTDLAHRIGARCDELARAAVALGCDDATVAALKGAAALTPDIVDGRAVLSNPTTWTEARLQANRVFQSEAIAGVPLNRAWEVGLDKLEHAATCKLKARAEPTGVASKGMRWQEAMKKAERHCCHNSFPGVNALAKLVGCAASTMSKAIDRSAELRAKLAEQEAQRKSLSAVAMTEGVAASTKQTREADPIETASASTDDLFHRLLEQAKPLERAKLNAMTSAERRQLIATIEHDPEQRKSVQGRSR